MLFHVPLMVRHRVITAARLRNRFRRRRVALSTRPGQLVARMEMPQPGQLVARTVTVASASPREHLLVQAVRLVRVAVVQVVPAAVVVPVAVVAVPVAMAVVMGNVAASVVAEHH